MDRNDIVNLIHEKKLDYRPDNVSIFMKVSYPSSVVLNKTGNEYEVHITGPRNEVRSPYWKFDNIDKAVSFLVEKVSKDKEVAEQYGKLGVEWPPSPV